ncbi:hypothetical protein BS47DRAFT_1213102 [Hydnum rufescens UP504]|uniref:Cytochrome c oxidase assembly protein COX20, mitochondrial n=1 Tax=Hydnum rufescens UP504 TaxID=1448309 RepID=A0A9P6ASA0_9AGAM|nr:hypothetical protein BS47DRAFT_1213102 [Hydnum rufescens UP504]
MVSEPSSGSQSDPSLPGSVKPELKEAIKRINVVDDFRNLPRYPCARESLMYGMATGTAIGAVRNIRTASNWAVGTFIFVAAASWSVCRAARERELRTTQAIIEKFPERNVRVARQRAEERRGQELGTESAADGGTSTLREMSSSNQEPDPGSRGRKAK